METSIVDMMIVLLGLSITLADGLECRMQNPEPPPVLCRSEGHYWQNYNGTIPGWADNVIPDDGKSYPGGLYVGYFRSSDKKLHVTLIDGDGRLRFDNGGDMIKPIKILMRYAPYQQFDFSYVGTWPGTMNSYQFKNKDLREEVLAIGVEDNKLAYLGMVPKKTILGKVVWDPTSKDKPLYELVYWDEDEKKMKRTKKFWVMVSNECKSVLGES